MHKQIKGLIEYAEILNSHMQYFHKKVLSIQQREIFTSIWHHCAMLPDEHKKHWRHRATGNYNFTVKLWNGFCGIKGSYGMIGVHLLRCHD